MPVVHAVPTLNGPHPGDDALAVRILASIEPTDACDLLHDHEAQAQDASLPALWHLDGARVLVTTLYWRGAYNTGDGDWVANAKPPYDPKLVTNSGTGFEEKTGITSQEKGRGIADCLGNEAWTWNGRDVVQPDASTTGLCRGVVPGGTWNLPTIVARVIPAK